MTMLKRTKERFVTFLVIVATVMLLSMIMGCASLWPLGGAMVGASAGSLGGPGVAALGAGAGYGAGKVLEVSTTEDPASVIAKKVDGMTAADIERLIASTVGKQGFFDKITSEVYGLLKLFALGVALFFVGQFVWTWKRKKRGEQFYSELKELKSKLN